jgi:hypothetical protein
MNSLSRTDADEVTHDDAAFAEIIQSGMALDSANRIASMQDVVIKLSPYNVRPFVNTAGVEQNQSPAPAVQKAKPARKKIVLVAAIVLLVALLGSYTGCYFAARINAQNGEFATADSLLFAAPITKIHDAKLVAYIEAGQLMAARNYADAKTGFESVSGYMNADEMAKEADYRHAVQYADANEFDKAISIMSALEKLGYKDAGDKALEIQYRKGVYLLMEKANFAEANKIFTQLAKKKYNGAEDMQKETQYLWAVALIEDEDYVGAYKKLIGIKNYSDVKDVLEALEEVIYAEGQNLYYSEKFSDAKTRFDCVSSYRDSKKYITLIDARGFSALSDPEGTVKELVDIFYFEDAAELLVSSTDVACYFLLGNWKTSNGGYYFKMELSDDDEYSFWSSYNLPWYGGSFMIEDGIYSVSNDSYEDKPQYRFTLITPDSMEVYCYKNGTTYTLYR